MVIMIDNESASASEIFAGSIAVHHRGVLVGDYSFGKMNSQKPYMIGEKNGIGGLMYLTESVLIFSDQTTAQWHRLPPHVWLKDPETSFLSQSKDNVYEFQYTDAIVPSQSAPAWGEENQASSVGNGNVPN